MILEKVKQILADQLNYDIKKITPKTSLIDDLMADSLDVVAMIEEFETGFNVSITDDEIEKMTTVQDVVDLLTVKTKNKK